MTTDAKDVEWLMDGVLDAVDEIEAACHPLSSLASYEIAHRKLRLALSGITALTQEVTQQRDDARRERERLRETVQTAVPHILANIHHVSGCLYFTPQKVCNCGTRPAYEALTALTDAARTAALAPEAL